MAEIVHKNHAAGLPKLLGPGDPAPVAITNPRGRSPYLFIADHAGLKIPASLGTLGVGAEDRRRHIAWDIGTAALGTYLAREMDAVFMHQAYSRLVIDCNRDPSAVDAIPTHSDGIAVPRNSGLTAQERQDRVHSIHTPYHEAIADEIGRRGRSGQPTRLISLHSFTPSMNGFDRPWQVGILHDGANDHMARVLLAWLQKQERWIVGDNAPYQMDATDYTVPRHAFSAGLSYVEIEISQSELGTPRGITSWGLSLSDGLLALKD